MLCSEVRCSRHLCVSSVCLHNFKKSLSSTKKNDLESYELVAASQKKASNTFFPEKGCKLFTLNQMCDVPDIFYAYPKKQAFLCKNNFLRKKKLIFFQIL